ncbi:MAG: RHS repeat protein, partial [Gammaproteobacteria bacterium]|nr:RHS repeat protein [Gammaproteobacteria bacterium]
MKSITDDNGSKTSYEYDNQGRTKKITYPDNTFIEYTYDGNSNIKTIKQRNGVVVTNNYDLLNRLYNRTIQHIGDPEGTTRETYEYDGLSRVTKATDDDSEVLYQYDHRSLLTGETQFNKLMNYTYDKLNNRVSHQFGNGRIIERSFDVLNRLSTIKQGTDEIASYEYIGRGYRYLSKQYNNGDAIQYLYDQGRRLTTKDTMNKNQAIVNKYVYGYNKIHLKTFEKRDHQGGLGDQYGNDEISRLTSVKFDSTEPSNPETTQFDKSWSTTFDGVDNTKKITTTENEQATEIIPEYNNLNQTTRFDGWGITYDLNGNMSQKGGQRFYYDYRNQLIRVTESGTTIQYNYDAGGRRIEKIVNGDPLKSRRYYYEGFRVIEERDGNDQLLKQFVYGNGIDELLRIDVYDNGSMVSYYVHTNDVGSVTAINDVDGKVLERVTYDVYGMATITDYRDSQNPVVVTNSVIDNNILFQGRRYDK